MTIKVSFLIWCFHQKNVCSKKLDKAVVIFSKIEILEERCVAMLSKQHVVVISLVVSHKVS